MAKGRGRAAGRDERRTGRALLVLCLVAYAYVVPRGPDHNPDSRLALTYSLVERAALTIDPYAHVTRDRAVRDGHYYSDKAPGVSFWLAPLYAALRHLPLAAEPTEDRFVTRYLLTFLGIGVPNAVFATWLFHWLCRFVPSRGPRAAAMLGYAVGSPAYAYSLHAFGHVPAGICLFAGAALLTGRAPPASAVLAGVALGGAVAFEYPAAVPAALLAALAARAPAGERLGQTARVLSGAAAPLGALALYHALAFGAPWRTGYAFLDPSGEFAAVQGSGFYGLGRPSPATAIELLVGVKRGLLVVSPWLALCVPGALLLWRRRETAGRRWVVCAALVAGTLLAVNSAYAIWDGGAAWGPRHLAPALPFLAVIALVAIDRHARLAGALLALSVALTIAGVSTGTLPPPQAPSVIGDYLVPALRDGGAGNTLGNAFGLAGWRALVPLPAVALLCWVSIRGLRRTYGLALVCSVALVSAATLDARYVEYAEGYYLYLGARVADGAVLYGDTASTQTPLLPVIIGAVWRALPGVYVPRLLALACYVGAALLAGRLAARLGGGRGAAQLATAIAALLPLGATTPFVLDANAPLAPLGAALVLLTLSGTRRGAAFAGLIAAGGVATKLTFLPLALPPLAALRHGRIVYGIALLAGGAAGGAAVAAWSGSKALDGILGELESPMLPAGAALAAIQLVSIEGFALAFAAAGWWHLRARADLRPAHSVLAGAALLPLLALHQGTFVSAARPAEPVIAAYAACGIVSLAGRLTIGARLAVPGLAVLAVVVPIASVVVGRAGVASPGDEPLTWIGRQAAGETFAPPYFAALSGRVMPFDYADWTVLGMRAAAGVQPEAAYAVRISRDLERGEFPLVVSDFRLGYIPGAMAALARGYTLVATDGSGPLEVGVWLPKRSADGTANTTSASSGQTARLSPGQRA